MIVPPETYEKMKKFILFLVLALISVFSAFARKVTLSGYVKDKSNGETLIGAAVMLSEGKIGTVSNEYGFYSLTVDAGIKTIECSFIGYKIQRVDADFQEDTSIVFQLSPDAAISEAVVSAHRENGAASSYLGAMQISRQLLETYPAVFGESDMVKIVQTLPGVQSGMSGFSGIYVRGGGADENLVMLDGTPVYNLNHMFGLFSLFMPETVKNVDIYKGSFPARYGGRASSIINVRTIDGGKESLHGSVSVGLLTDKFFLNGPIGKKKTTTFSVGIRGLHSFLLDPLVSLAGAPYNYAFYDCNVKLSHIFSERDRIYFTSYYGNDYFRYHGTTTYADAETYTKRSSEEKLRLRWGNASLRAGWNHVFTNRLFADFSIYANRYAMNLSNRENINETSSGIQTSTLEDTRFFSGIDDQGLRVDFDYSPNPRHRVSFGAEALNHIFRPQTSDITSTVSGSDMSQSDTSVNNAVSRRIIGQEAALYAEDDMHFMESRLRVALGCRLTFFTVRGKYYLSPEPRFSVAFEFLPDWMVKCGYSRMSQYVHQLTSGTLSLPTDLWIPVTEHIEPVYSDIWSSGLYCLMLKGWEFSAEVYYKELYHVLEYKDGREAFSGTGNWEDNVEMGKGRSKGIELYARKTTGRITGSLAYTLSKSDRWFPDGSINLGRVYPFKYDRRHVLNTGVSWKLNDRIDFGAAWSFCTGYRITVPIRKTVVESTDGTESMLNYVPTRNNFTTPPSHHLDLRCNLRTDSKRGKGVWNFTVYNVYNAMNPDWMLYLDRAAYGGKSGMSFDSAISVRTFLTILPSVSYTWMF